MPPFVLMTLLASGLLAGFVHVVSGPDHLAAIAPYAVDAKARAWRTGIRWGVGHSAGVVGVGLFALLLRDTMS
ncbi:High-affinity nickel transporter, partial [Rhizobium ruizarguesonis]